MKPTMSMYTNHKEWLAAHKQWEDEQLARHGTVPDVQDEEYFDDLGNTAPGGLYDIGGHIVPERLGDFLDYTFERDWDS